VIASIVSLEKIRSPGILQAYDGWSYPTYLSLPQGSITSEYESKIVELLGKFNYDQKFRLKSFDKIYYSAEVENESNTKHGNLLYNRILTAVSLFILLLAAINFINLLLYLTRSEGNKSEKLQGFKPVDYTIQFETTIFIFLIVLAFIFLWFFNPLLSSLTGFSVSAADFCTSRNLIILVSGLIIFIIITGIYPSLYISSYTINIYKAKGRGSSGHIGIRNGLIIFQNLVSCFVIFAQW
jgi:putative ABC transport system permease protein